MTPAETKTSVESAENVIWRNCTAPASSPPAFFAGVLEERLIPERSSEDDDDDDDSAAFAGDDFARPDGRTSLTSGSSLALSKIMTDSASEPSAASILPSGETAMDE